MGANYGKAWCVVVHVCLHGDGDLPACLFTQPRHGCGVMCVALVALMGGIVR